MPSVCFETFGIIMIEAFRQGTPVIARRIGPFPEIIDRAGGGLLFEDAERAARLRCSASSSERGLRGAAVTRGLREHLCEYWSESAVVPEYLGADPPRGGEQRAARKLPTR